MLNVSELYQFGFSNCIYVVLGILKERPLGYTNVFRETSSSMMISFGRSPRCPSALIQEIPREIGFRSIIEYARIFEKVDLSAGEQVVLPQPISFDGEQHQTFYHFDKETYSYLVKESYVTSARIVKGP